MIENANAVGKFKIRPAARHVFTIGEGLIKDSYSALVELVKNSYDADAEKVAIEFSAKNEGETNSLIINFTDNGHGMSFDTVTNIWMVPSTEDKQERRFSPYMKRPMQGRKGIGRYAVAILGNELLMETTKDGITTTLLIDWDEYLKPEYKYLDEIDILIEAARDNKPNGTHFEIVGNESKLIEWDQWQIDNLINELRKLLSPVHEKETLNFEINLSFKDFPVEKYNNRLIKIEPYPIVDLFDYRISGTIDELGKGTLLFENNSIKGIPNEKVEFEARISPRAKNCGVIYCDFRVFDRDPQAIENLINRGLSDPKTGNRLGKNEARKLLDEVNGIGVYREGFRIRPHGDPGYDWLELDRARVQDPSFHIGSNQVIGFIQIEPEEKSHLVERSSREGLKEDKYYWGLVETAKLVINTLERIRYSFKIKTGKAKSKRNITSKLDKVIDSSDLKVSLEKELNKIGVNNDVKNRIFNLIDNNLNEKTKIIEDVKLAIADYQGQATLGSILKVVLHEGNNPVGFISRQIPNIIDWISELKQEPTPELLDKISNRLLLLKEQAQVFLNLFSRLTPLAANRRKKADLFLLANPIKQAEAVLESKLKESNITLRLEGDTNLKVKGWPEDFLATFINLIDNSIYWLSPEQKSDKRILISINQENDNNEEITIHYRDNGPGIEKKFIEEESIFEPGFTSKPAGQGHGLGMAIAGEAMARNNGKLTAIYDDNGVHFIITLKTQIDE
ncbi:ATP-binding protein [Rufibacter sediminis]|uniref:histidine kinase n=1 Tax=Rufibacter sediminis TaxID=2762756 RepID=A0ABR6VRN7_9BACT|nr:sensor histidine kinase [Rufibacter sediminis]MBC3539580.1 sensor histidine kinase [Rufibacter sediminis]